MTVTEAGGPKGIGKWSTTKVPIWGGEVDGVRVEASSPFEGIAEDVNEAGALLVRADDGTLRTVLAGDVRLRPASS